MQVKVCKDPDRSTFLDISIALDGPKRYGCRSSFPGYRGIATRDSGGLFPGAAIVSRTARREAGTKARSAKGLSSAIRRQNSLRAG